MNDRVGSLRTTDYCGVRNLSSEAQHVWRPLRIGRYGILPLAWTQGEQAMLTTLIIAAGVALLASVLYQAGIGREIERDK